MYESEIKLSGCFNVEMVIFEINVNVALRLFSAYDTLCLVNKC